MRAEIVDRVEQVLRAAGALDTELAALLHTVAADTAGPDPSPPVVAAAAIGVPAPPGGSVADSVADSAGWWSVLSPAARQRVVAEHPEWIGNRDGIPAAARDEANRRLLGERAARLDADLGALQARYDALTAAGPGPMEPAWLAARDDLLARLAELRRRQEVVDAVGAAAAGADRRLLLLDLDRDRPRAAVATGDVDTADHVAVLTPGFGNTVGGDLPGVVETAGALRDRSAAVLDGSGRGGESVAAVAWLGYDVPGGPLNVSTADAARRGGADLARFYDGIDAARPTDPHLTALGHSYGSLTTGYALQQAHGVDDAVLFGSPGIGTDDLGDVHVPAGHTGVVEAPWDPVADLGWFGDDPNRLDGVTGLSARAATLPDGAAAAGSVLHSQYLTPGTTSQYNIAATVAGLPGQRILDPGVGVGDVLRDALGRRPAMIGARDSIGRPSAARLVRSGRGGAVLARAHPARPLERRAQREGGAVADPAGHGGQGRVGVAQQVRRQRQAPARQELHRRLAHQLGEAAGQRRAGDPGRGGERADRPRPRRVVVQQLQRPADERVRVRRVPGGRLPRRAGRTTPAAR